MRDTSKCQFLVCCENCKWCDLDHGYFAYCNLHEAEKGLFESCKDFIKYQQVSDFTQNEKQT